MTDGVVEGDSGCVKGSASLDYPLCRPLSRRSVGDQCRLAVRMTGTGCGGQLEG